MYLRSVAARVLSLIALSAAAGARRVAVNIAVDPSVHSERLPDACFNVLAQSRHRTAPDDFLHVCLLLQ